MFIKPAEKISKQVKPYIEQGSRKLSLTTEEMMKQFKMETSLAKEKISKLPEDIKEKLAPFFSKSFLKEKEI